MEAIEDHWPGYWSKREWPTRDGVIPWRYCFLLLHRLPQRRAHLQLRQIEALSVAFGLTQAGSHAAAAIAVNRLQAEARGHR